MFGVFTAAVSFDTFYKSSSLVTLHDKIRQSDAFVDALDRSVYSITAAETAERGFRLTGDETYKKEFETALSSYRSGRDGLQNYWNGSDRTGLTGLEEKMAIRETALLDALARPSRNLSDDPENTMRPLQASAADLRQVAMAQLGQQSHESARIEKNAGTRLTVLVTLALICILATVVVSHFQNMARQKITRRLQLERLSAIAANRTKSSFLAYTSHELRTPLNAIIGFSEFMMMEYAGPLTERQKQYLSDIRGSGMHLQALISDILDLTKAEAGKITLTEQAIVVPELIGSCVKLVEGQAKEAGVNLVTMIAPDLPQLYADELRCKQILINVAINAIQFTPRDGEVHLQARRDSNGAMLFVITDTGRGIPNEDLPKVVEPYFRSGIDEPSHKGYGLGLPLARKIAELHGGTLMLDSEIGRGTTVTITLPAHRIRPAAETVPVQEQTAEIVLLQTKLANRA